MDGHFDNIMNLKNEIKEKELSIGTETHSLSEQEITAHVQEGDAYFHGKNNYPVDKTKAIFHYEIAAMHGNSYAQLMAGYMYDYGDGVSLDTKKAIKYYSDAMNQGDSNAAGNLANIYLLGRGVPIDMETAISLLKRAAKLGSALAASSLGRLYTIGDGVEKSLVKAEFWITRAELAGYVNCGTMTNLGLMYAEIKDYSKAFQCFEKALDADVSDLNIQYLYGKYKFFGQGTTTDAIQAKTHIQWVVDQDPNNKDACELLCQINLYEMIQTALLVIKTTLSEEANTWDFQLTIYCNNGGYLFRLLFADSPNLSFKKSVFWDYFSKAFYPDEKNEMSLDNYTIVFESAIKHPSSSEVNFNYLLRVVDMVSKEYPYVSISNAENYIVLKWRAD
ncbi:MAG: sel1 repeat family protein [Clostridiales bacterium]|nr:sel1 repeat family protein [Clostridiales bacterium]